MKTVIFACVHNAGRSQMAAAWFNALADSTKARAISAGTSPGSRVHPEVVEAMLEAGIDLSEKSPQRLTDELARQAHMLITMGCGEQCPAVPRLNREDWSLEDPKGKSVESVRKIRDEVRARVVVLLRREGWARGWIRAARPSDRASIEALLRGAELPIDGVAEHLDSFFVAEEGGSVVGLGGLEWYGDAALLRSLVVAGDGRGRGLGAALTRHALVEARSRGAQAVYLLTTTAAAFFPRFGFEQINRAEVPLTVHASREFHGACPASAIAMRLSLNPSRRGDRGE